MGWQANDLISGAIMFQLLRLFGKPTICKDGRLPVPFKQKIVPEKEITISSREKSTCLGKVKHKSMLAAQEVLDIMEIKRGRKGEEINIYTCQFCGDLHIGHLPKLKKKTKIEKK